VFKASIRREGEATLQRLKVHTIDLCQIHWPAWSGNPEIAAPGSIEQAAIAPPKLTEVGVIVYSPMASGLLSGP
jgi:aryl-alcohol dehydrogenase-like predicted oxidoreductase